ncbi:MAG: CCA tRNA nucleotidyltransferase [Phycisphaerales bacterium]|nr:CCA tRNA nucleotidyltransferase [Phycisphaerales bacterium]
MTEVNFPSGPSISARDAAAEIAAKFSAAGHTAYFAGGCVRDELLNFSPIDFDIATSATTEQIRSIFPKARGVGESFGVILVHHKGRVVEVASFRADGLYVDGRRPEDIEVGDEKTDANRRDFTINGMFMHPASGDIIDHVNGRADIQNKILRAINNPDARLSEDRLRLLRAVRFAARFDLSIEPKTETAIRAHAHELRGVSRERVGQELRRMIAHPSRVKALELIESLGLAPSTLLETSPPTSLQRVRSLATTVAQSTASPPQSETLQAQQLATVLAAWLLDRQSTLPWQERVNQWTSALVLSNKERDALMSTLQLQITLPQWATFSKALQKRTAANLSFTDALQVFATDAPDAAARIQKDFQLLEKEGISPAPWLCGDDLIDMGLRAGPEFRRILDAVYDAQLEGTLTNKSAAKLFAKQLSKG